MLVFKLIYVSKMDHWCVDLARLPLFQQKPVYFPCCLCRKVNKYIKSTRFLVSVYQTACKPTYMQPFVSRYAAWKFIHTLVYLFVNVFNMQWQYSFVCQFWILLFVNPLAKNHISQLQHRSHQIDRRPSWSKGPSWQCFSQNINRHVHWTRYGHDSAKQMLY